MKLALFVELKYQSYTKIPSVCVKYYVRDLLTDVSNCLARKLAICVT